MKDLSQQLEEILLSVQKPSQYVNSEWLSEETKETKFKVALIYPDLYQIGFTNLGILILYRLINQLDNWSCERAYLPQVDLQEVLVKRKIPLFSLESQRPLKSFNILGFTLQSELNYPDILTVLSLSNIPLLSKDRCDDDPVVIAGGPGAFNPEPLASFIDAFVLGDGEEVILELLQVYEANREKTRQQLLEKWAEIAGVYVPAFLEPVLESNQVSEFKVKAGLKLPIHRRILNNLDLFSLPVPLVPFSSVVHDRCSLEIMRGCGRGCRFCQAGVVYRPVREREPKEFVRKSIEILKKTGFEEIALTSLSTSDYSKIEEVLEGLVPFTERRGISISLPSLRLDSFSLRLAELVGKTKKTGLTFAPEAASERLRRKINKSMSEERYLKTIREAFSSGWQRLKLYFMIGLPGEEREDLEAIGEMLKQAVQIGQEIAPKQEKGRVNINVTISTFVPKAFTPFQWAAQLSPEEAKERIGIVRRLARGKGINLKIHDPHQALVEGVIARGGREVGDLILEVFKSKATLQSWREHFSFEVWVRAAEKLNLSWQDYLAERSLETIFPWDFIDIGVKKEFLIAEWKKSLIGQVTSCCHTGCEICGLCGSSAERGLDVQAENKT